MAVVASTDLGDGREHLTLSHDPTAVATEAKLGSTAFSTTTELFYRKFDDGNTTNWFKHSATELVDQASDESETSTSSTTLATKVSLTYTPTESGNYFVFAILEARTSSGSALLDCELALDTVDVNDAGAHFDIAGSRFTVIMAKVVPLTAGFAHFFNLKFARDGSGGGGTISARRSRIYLFRTP
jgi:hypothetical protein